MTTLTNRDYIWKAALDARRAAENHSHNHATFTAEDIARIVSNTDDVSEPPSLRTVRDVLKSMVELGELEGRVRVGRTTRFTLPND